MGRHTGDGCAVHSDGPDALSHGEAPFGL